MSFIQRLINVKFQLAQGAAPFLGTNSNTLTLGGLRVSAKVTGAGSVGPAEAVISINGMTPQTMNQLSTLGQQIKLGTRNKVTLLAGDSVNGLTQVFVGDIVSAYIDFSNAPDVAFIVQSYPFAADALAPGNATSYTQSTDVVSVVQDLASRMNGGQGYPFVNVGVNGITLDTPYLWGSLRDQLTSVIRAAGIDWNQGDDGTVTIWPQSSSRGGNIPLISADTGMVGYPNYEPQGVSVKILFNPQIKRGSQIQIESSILPPNGPPWKIYYIDHVLESLKPGGQWFSTLHCQNPNAVQQITPTPS